MTKSATAIQIGLLLAGIHVPAIAQEPDLNLILSFEAGGSAERLPLGWGGGPPGTISFDSAMAHSGSGAARLQRGPNSPRSFSTLTMRIPLDFTGDYVLLSGYLRSEGVTDFMGLWMRQDGPAGVLEFDNMQSRGIRGTTDWQQHFIRLPLNPNARDLYIGVLVSGEGTVWADDLSLTVDDRPIASAPKRTVEPTILETDREFDSGSGIEAASLTKRQIDDLVVLGRIWGFLKYHHPRVAAGELHWDYELMRVLPEVLRARNGAERNRTLTEWIDRLGVPDECDPCASPPERPQLGTQLEWVDDTVTLGPELSRRLGQIYRNRFAGSEQFFVSKVGGIGNPIFDRELVYPGQQPPDSGFRILSLLRFWNIIEYWFPYRNQLDEAWIEVLREFLPRFVAAESWEAYRLELLALVGRITDTHASLPAAYELRPPTGDCSWPVTFRFVEDRPTVIGYTDAEYGPQSGYMIGDVVLAVAGQSVGSLIDAWLPYYAASNEAAARRAIATFFPRGACGPISVTIQRRGEVQEIVAPRLSALGRQPFPHDRPGETFQLLSPDVAYLKLSTLRANEVDEYLERASGTRGLVIDIRNYPMEFVVFTLGQRLVDSPTPFARFTAGDLHNPGAFNWSAVVSLQPQAPVYPGQVAILVDESSISQSEYTAMALRANPRAVVVGSTTAGADGDVSRIGLPGGLQTMISGIGVFYPDGTPTQRVGIIPDIWAAPTVEGIREGRDEVLEAAVRHILGPEADEVEVRAMARRPAIEN